MRKVVDIRAPLIDEYGELCRREKEFAPVSDRRKELEKQIQAWYDSSDPTASYVAEGTQYTVHVGARRRVRTITHMAKLFLRVGKPRFLEACTFPMAALDRLLLPAAQAGLVAESQTGPRRVEAVAKGAPVPLRLAA